jgi:hypothetical protein
MSDDLDELLRLHGKATGGEWHVNEFDDAADEVERYQVQTSRRQGGDIGGTVLAVFDAEWILPRQAKANAELAVSAHNALPGLIERVRKAEAERDALRGAAVGLAGMVESDLERATPQKGGQQCGHGGDLGPVPPSVSHYLRRLARTLREMGETP